MARIVITGLGQISALGHDVASFWRAIAEGKTGIAEVNETLYPHLTFKQGAEVRDYSPEAHFSGRILTTIDRFSQFSVIAAREAVAQAGLDLSDAEVSARTAVVAGTGAGGQTTLDEAYHRLYARGQRLHPMTIPRFMVSAAASQISMDLGIHGPTFSVSSACSTANHAMGVAWMMLKTGQADYAICGGSETSFTVGAMKGWEAMRVTSPDTCRPFCVDRRGLIVGEGAGILVMEAEESARARGAEILAEFAGFGFTSDADDLVQPSEDGAAAAMRQAMRSAGMAPDDVGYINAHGTGTVLNDPNEVRAIKRALGEDRARAIPVSSTKAAHGHCFGATGALEIIATIEGMRRSVLPPTVNFTQAAPDCDLDFVPNEARDQRFDAALSNNLAFGGLNATVAVRRFAG